MVEITDITDQDSLKAWLQEQPREVWIWIARRAALRVLSYYWEWTVTSDVANERDLTALPTLRFNLTSEVAHKMPTSDIMDVAASAARASAARAAASTSASTSVYVYASAARAAADAYAAVSITTTAAAASAARVATVWPSIRADCEAIATDADLDHLPLWVGGDNPLASEWQHLKQQLTVSGPHRSDETARGPVAVDWSFWVRWYDSVLAGEPLNWDMLEKIALIEDQEWAKGPARVNFLIAGIEAEFLAEKAPLAEKVEFNPEAAKFFAIPIPVAKPDLLGATLSQVADALEDARADQGNGLSDDSREVRVLNRTLSKYGNDPQRIEMDFTSVAVGLRRQIHDTNELPNGEENLALLRAVEEGALGIRATHPEVAANRELLAGQALRELSDQDKELLREAEPILVAISAGVMAEDFAADIPELINDALLPLPDGAPQLPAMDPSLRVFSRASKMALLMQESSNIVEAIDESLAYKALKIIKTGAAVLEWLSAIVRIGLRLFGVL